jgi:hypothetical protein
VIVAVITVRMMQTIVDQIVDVVAVWHSLVPATRSVLVPRFMALLGIRGRAAIGVLFIDGDLMLVHVVAVGIVQMPVVQIVRVTVMANRDVPAGGAVLVIMAWMDGVFGHGAFLS